jgi:hypothetical protein
MVSPWTGRNIQSESTMPRSVTPMRLEEAIAAFGTPDFDTDGPASDIETNHGSGGDFVKTGTATDATW